MDELSGGVIGESTQWLVTQGALGIAVVLLIAVIIVQRRDLARLEGKIDARDKVIQELQTARYNDLKAAFEPIHALKTAIEAMLEARKR